MTRHSNALGLLGAALVCAAAVASGTACSSRDPNETSTPISVTQTGPSSIPSLSTSTTEKPATPEKTPPGGIGGTGG